jgi:hypothetical protein
MLMMLKRRAELIAERTRLRRLLLDMQNAPVLTISDRIARTDACCQARQALAALEKQLEVITDETADNRQAYETRK